MTFSARAAPRCARANAHCPSSAHLEYMARAFAPTVTVLAALSLSPIPPIPIIACFGARTRISHVIAICLGKRGSPLIPPLKRVIFQCSFIESSVFKSVPMIPPYHSLLSIFSRISESVVVFVELYPVTKSLLASIIALRVSSSVSGEIFRKIGFPSAASLIHRSALMRNSIFFSPSLPPF